ncbi:MAG: cytochrome b [Candidatus Promineifilaceae bacterium]
MAFIDEVKELGIKQAAIAKLDDTVLRVTAGMNINDIRAALRGDEPRRPNPRLRPHADGFWFHIRPSFYHAEVTHIYPTFRLGWLSTFMFIWETLTGIFLMIFYTPEPDTAYSDMWNIMSNVPLGQLMRNMHRFGAEVMVLVVALHMLRTFVTGSYKKPRQFTWLTGMVLLCLTLILSFSGYLLPWDQLAYWAVTVAVSAAESSPGPPALGKNINLLIRGAPSIGAGGLLRFYLLHVLALPLLMGIFTFVHYYKVVLHGHSLPPGREAIGEDTAKRVPKNERVYFTPDILSNEIMWAALTTLFLVGGSMFLPVGLGSAAIETHSSPTVTPLHVVAPWYLSWSQGWLKLKFEWMPIPFLRDSKVVVSFILIPVLAVAFFVWPYVEELFAKMTNRSGMWVVSRRYADRRGELSLSMFFVAFMLVSNWMGSPKFLVRGSADQEVAQELMPQEGHSPVLETPYEQLVPGVYRPGDEIAGAPELNHALEEFEHSLYLFSCSLQEGGGEYHLEECITSVDASGTTRYASSFTNDVMVDPSAKMVIEQVQHNMVKITLYITAENPNTDTNELVFDTTWVKFRHADSFYEEY